MAEHVHFDIEDMERRLRATIPDDAPADELPEIEEMVATMREVIAADTALMTVITDEARSHGAFMENSKRLTAALNAQRVLLARIDTILTSEPTP